MGDKEKRPAHRPTDYNEELANQICELIATSPLGTNKLCKLHDWMPSEDTVYKWRYRHNEFAEKYTKAKARQAELMVEQIIDISDDKSDDILFDEHGNKKIDAGAVAHRRLQVDSRKWYASKLAPKIYGDKVDHKHDVNIKQEDAIELLK